MDVIIYIENMKKSIYKLLGLMRLARLVDSGQFTKFTSVYWQQTENYI